MITLLLAASALAGTVSVFSLPDIATDSASGINPSNSYLCALNFGGGTNPIFINGVPFQPVHLNGKGTGPDECHPFFSGSDTNHAGTWSVSATVAGGDGFADDSIGESFVGVPFQSDGAMSALLGHMSYVRAGAQDLTNGSTIQMHFGGLTAGTKYSLRYYYRQWSKKRYINFSFNNGETEDAYAGNPLDLDAGGAGFVDYDFTAVTNEISMKMEVCTAGYGPHIFGVTLQPLLPGTGKHGGVIKSAVASKNLPSDKYGVGWWIWASETGDLQTCRFWKSFVIPETASVRSAILRITADNSYRVFLDGQDLGHGADWTSLTAYDLSLLLKKSGQHVLAVEAANDFGPAGVILGLNIQLNNGELITVGSDESWRVVPNDERDWTTREYAYLSWPKAKIVGAAGASPWKVLSWDWGTLIYNAPKLQPLVMPFWQKLWFQVSIFSFLLISIAIGIYLTGRLILNSKEHSVIQRERARIARDLHDSLSAGLTQLVVYGESTKNDLRAYPEVQPDLDEICLKARSLLDSLKETIWIVNSQRDSLRDLIMHLCDYTEMFLKPTGIRCRFDLAADLPTLPCDVGIRRNLMLAVKEALCNVIKYSEAQELQLRIHWDDHKIVVRVEDDGKGFDPAKASKERDGLHNMEQRAKDAGGRCSVVSAPGAGCQVEISVPLRRLRRFQLWSRTQPEDHHDQLTFPLKPGTAQVAERSRAKSA
ncbi:MAG TPA: sensor histidine kinase [Verrucomicrobiae bacterium]